MIKIIKEISIWFLCCLMVSVLCVGIYGMIKLFAYNDLFFYVLFTLIYTSLFGTGIYLFFRS